MNEQIIAILIGGAGGLCIKLLELLELSKIPHRSRPDFKQWQYIIPYILLPLFGAFVVYIYQSSGKLVDNIIAFHLGASAPLIIRTMVAAIPSKVYLPQGA